MDMRNRPITGTDPSEDNKVSHVFPCIARASTLMASGMRIDLLPLIRTRWEVAVGQAARVYEGLTTDQIAQVESIVFDRRHFMREPAA